MEYKSTQVKQKSQARRGAAFNGHGRLKFAFKSENGKFNYGLKYGKCLKLREGSAFRSLKGDFVDDHLQGWVLIGNADDSSTIVHVKDNRPVGIVRTFVNDKLVNVTNVKGEGRQALADAADSGDDTSIMQARPSGARRRLGAGIASTTRPATTSAPCTRERPSPGRSSSTASLSIACTCMTVGRWPRSRPQ